MRKVIFTIDDLEYFKCLYGEQFITGFFGDAESFRAIYTLIGEGNTPDRSFLTDFSGNKIPRDTLDGYQKGVVLNDCYAYFTGGSYANHGSSPCGVIKIEEQQL